MNETETLNEAIDVIKMAMAAYECDPYVFETRQDFEARAQAIIDRLLALRGP